MGQIRRRQFPIAAGAMLAAPRAFTLPTILELVVHCRAAAAMAHAVPPSILDRADRAVD
jgi:hypothetical protein